MPELNQIRLSISEAARLFGIDAKTIRRAIKAQEIRYIVVRGRYKLNFESLIKWSQRKVTVRNKSNQQGIGQYVGQWKISNKLYTPNPPKDTPQSFRAKPVISIPRETQITQ